MLIRQVCKKCSLTKKAREYYEKQGLVCPKVNENGYRNYNNKDISILKEISVLRRLGLSINDIKDVLSSSNKSATLSKYKYLMNLKMEKATVSHLFNAVEDIDNYISSNKKSLEEYIEIRNSEEFKSSPAYKFQQLLLDFHQSNGYYEIFIPNLKILSPSYSEYADKLQEANKLFIEKYPQMASVCQKG